MLGAWALVAAISAVAWAADPPVPPLAASGHQFSIAVLPDPQAYTQSYDVARGGERWGGRGYQYKERLEKQVQWIVDSRDTYGIRFAVCLGDNVQHFGYDPRKALAPGSDDAKIRGEWLNAQQAYNLFHPAGDPTRRAFLPYAIACGNHDYHLGNPADLDSREYVQFFGPGRWRDARSAVRPEFSAWYKGDDKDWPYRAGGEVLATGVGRNSWQVFSAGGREFLHLTLECGATDQALAWARGVLDADPGKPTILTTHAFIDGSGKWVPPDGMGRYVKGGKNPTNGAQGIWDKLIRDRDQVFMVLCGHKWGQKRVTARNAAGHEVHILEACYHLNYAGGRIALRQRPPTGWRYTGQTDDPDRNGSGWLRLILFDPDAEKVAVYTYSPVLGLWATDRKPDDHSRPDGQDGVWWNRTFPVGEDVVDEFDFDLRGRFGPVAAGADKNSSPRTQRAQREGRE